MNTKTGLRNPTFNTVKPLYTQHFNESYTGFWQVRRPYVPYQRDLRYINL